MTPRSNKPNEKTSTYISIQPVQAQICTRYKVYGPKRCSSSRISFYRSFSWSSTSASHTATAKNSSRTSALDITNREYCSPAYSFLRCPVTFYNGSSELDTIRSAFRSPSSTTLPVNAILREISRPKTLQACRTAMWSTCMLELQPKRQAFSTKPFHVITEPALLGIRTPKYDDKQQ